MSSTDLDSRLVLLQLQPQSEKLGFLRILQKKFAVTPNLPLILPYPRKTSCARDMGALSLLSRNWTTTWDVLVLPWVWPRGNDPHWTQWKRHPIPLVTRPRQLSVFQDTDAEVKLAWAILPGHDARERQEWFSKVPEWLEAVQHFHTRRAGGMKVPDGYWIPSQHFGGVSGHLHLLSGQHNNAQIYNIGLK